MLISIWGNRNKSPDTRGKTGNNNNNNNNNNGIPKNTTALLCHEILFTYVHFQSLWRVRL